MFIKKKIELKNKIRAVKATLINACCGIAYTVIKKTSNLTFVQQKMTHSHLPQS